MCASASDEWLGVFASASEEWLGVWFALIAASMTSCCLLFHVSSQARVTSWKSSCKLDFRTFHFRHASLDLQTYLKIRNLLIFTPVFGGSSLFLQPGEGASLCHFLQVLFHWSYFHWLYFWLTGLYRCGRFSKMKIWTMKKNQSEKLVFIVQGASPQQTLNIKT